jgi:hypothetical protein
MQTMTTNLLQNSLHTSLTPFEQTVPTSPKNLQY